MRAALLSHSLSIVQEMLSVEVAPWIVGEVLRADATEKSAYLLGASRDGYLHPRHHTLRISQRNRDWLILLQDLISSLGRRSWLYQETGREVWTLETGYLPPRLPSPSSKRQATGFARGYFDSEGGVPRSASARFYIQFAQKNLEDLSFLRHRLEDLGVRCGRIHNPSARVDPDYWRLFIAAESHLQFINGISSWHPTKRVLLMERGRTQLQSA